MNLYVTAGATFFPLVDVVGPRPTVTSVGGSVLACPLLLIVLWGLGAFWTVLGFVWAVLDRFLFTDGGGGDSGAFFGGGGLFRAGFPGLVGCDGLALAWCDDCILRRSSCRSGSPLGGVVLIRPRWSLPK